MKWREEVIGDCRLINADCREVLPTLGKVDAVVTDPPYGLGDRMQGGTWGKRPKYLEMRQRDQLAPQEVVTQLVDMAGETIVWGGNYFSLRPSRCWLMWDKTNAVPTMGDFEMAWTSLDRPAKTFRFPVGVHENGHPTEKPLALMRWCLGFIKSDTVLDPFMGSGTTGVACVKLGRSFIGIEREPKYFDIACRRIRAAYAQPDLFVSASPAPKPVQEALL